jgi:HSP20 family molecular chaperone IbpA
MPEKTDQIQPVDKRDTALAEQTRAGATFVPAVDIFETRDSITLLADMPGVNGDRLHVGLREGVLTLRGDVDKADREGEVDVVREYQPGTFVRQFALSDVIDQDRIEAKLTDGVLRLTLPKAEQAKPRQISVKAG